MPAARARSAADRDVPKPRSDAYVGLLGLSLLALIAAMLFAYLNWSAIGDKPPKAVQVAPRGPAGGGAPGAPPAPGQPVAPGAPGRPGAQVPPAPGQQPAAPPAVPPGGAQRPPQQPKQ
jgi:hypothetical protein